MAQLSHTMLPCPAQLQRVSSLMQTCSSQISIQKTESLKQKTSMICFNNVHPPSMKIQIANTKYKKKIETSAPQKKLPWFWYHLKRNCRLNCLIPPGRSPKTQQTRRRLVFLALQLIDNGESNELASSWPNGPWSSGMEGLVCVFPPKKKGVVSAYVCICVYIDQKQCVQ